VHGVARAGGLLADSDIVEFCVTEMAQISCQERHSCFCQHAHRIEDMVEILFESYVQKNAGRGSVASN
jgi:hypothetical protein